MNVKQFKRRWLNHYVEPELFYMPVGKKEKEESLSIILSGSAQETSGHGTSYAYYIHGYSKSVNISIYDNILNSIIVNEKYHQKLYKTINHSAYGGVSNFYYILNKNEEIVGEYQSLYNDNGNVYNFNIIINPKQLLNNKIILSRVRIDGHGRGSFSDQCKNRNHFANLRGSYIYSNCYINIDINNMGGYFYLKNIHSNIIDEILNSKISLGYIFWWIYIDIADRTIRSRYYILERNSFDWDLLDTYFDFAEPTDTILFSYK